MPLLDILSDVGSILENPAWLMFGLAGAVGLIGLAVLLFLYPFSRD